VVFISKSGRSGMYPLSRLLCGVCYFIPFGAFIYWRIRGCGWGILYMVMWDLHVLDCEFDRGYLIFCANATVLVVNA
jgi:hypothetical protein